MRSFIAAIFAIGALASPALIKKDDCEDTCLSYEQAYKVANNFKDLIATYSDELANKTVAEDFVDYSDSVNTLINSGCPNGPAVLGEPTFATRAQFEKGQGSQPAIPFEITNLWFACEGPVVIRWRSAQTPELVTGNIVIEVSKGTDSEEPYLIKTVYSEFNSGAWLVNLGVYTPVCPAPLPPGVGPSSNSTTKRSVPML